MLYGKARCGVLWLDHFVCSVDNQAVCYGWKILIYGEADCALWMQQSHFVGKHTVMRYRGTSLSAVWIHVHYVLGRTIMYCGEAHDVL